ncbi:MAG: RNA methyltransferase PUA domain-containing protein, partial [Actinomycetota bacterium]|nr:RNA methyltransferase PUA domain-containing protein [Actinomycetota bacterium]
MSELHELELPHIVLEDLDSPTLDETELHHLETVRRLRMGSHLTATDGKGSWSVFRIGKSTLTPLTVKQFCERPKV